MHIVREVRAEPHRLTLTTAHGSLDYALSDAVDHESVAATVADVIMPGVPARRVSESDEVGLFRKKSAERSIVRYRRHQGSPQVGGAAGAG